MDMTSAWIAMTVAGVGTFLMRFSFLALGERLSLPTPVRRALKFVPAAVLTTVIVPAVFRTPSGDLSFALDRPELWAALFAAAFAALTRNMFLTIVLGMLALWAGGYFLRGEFPIPLG